MRTGITFDQEYVGTHVVGFEQFRAYVMGEEDGVPKTPAWASEKTGVSEWTIKALADEWAEKVTSTIHYYGGSHIRGPYSHEPARLECCLQGMQELCRPGVHVYNKIADGLTQVDLPRPVKPLDLEGIRSQVWNGRTCTTSASRSSSSPGCSTTPPGRSSSRGRPAPSSTSRGGATLTTASDGFGDFWFEDLEEGRTFDLTIAAVGFNDKTFAGLETLESINLGEIPLEAAGR